MTDDKIAIDSYLAIGKYSTMQVLANNITIKDMLSYVAIVTS